MTQIASHALQAALYAALTADAGVLAALGGPRVHDAVPQNAPLPYIAIGPILSREIADTLQEHALTLDIWSRGGGQREAHAIAGAVIARLHDGDLALSGHRLVNLRLDLVDTRREADAGTYRASLRFRAVSEPDA